MLTQTDLINAKLTAEAALNNSDVIKLLIQDDVSSKVKKNMLAGERYYVGEQDIMQKDFRKEIIVETDEESGKETSKAFANPNRSNHHNVNTFHTTLVDQKAAYLVSREPTISVTGAEGNAELKAYETLLAEFADEAFNNTLSELVVGASNKGCEAVHFYYGKTDESLKHCIVPAEEIIPIYDTQYQEELVEVIRYYDIKVIKNDQTTHRKKVEWWTDTEVAYYIEDEVGRYHLDSSYPTNPMPHWWNIRLRNGAEISRKKHSWGRVPFVLLDNNRKRTTDLQLIKGLIDAYDLISSEGTNDFLDLVSLYWSIQGYGGETASTIANKLRVNKAVSISDTSGKISAEQVDLPVEGRISYLNMLRRDIFHFGMGVDTDNDKLGNASGVSLKFQYSQLKLKAGKMMPKLKKAIREMCWFLTADYNRNHGTAYDSDTIRIALNITEPTNDVETVQMIQNSIGLVSKKTLLGAHPLVDDVNNELEELEAEEKAEQGKWDERNLAPIKGGEGDEE